MTSKKSLQYFFTKNILERNSQKAQKIHLAQERLKEHIVFCPAKYCKIYEVYRKEKKNQDLLDYQCCPPEIKSDIEQEELNCPCEEVSCDYHDQQSQNFEHIPRFPLHPPSPPHPPPPPNHLHHPHPLHPHPHHHNHRHRHPPYGFACPHSFHGPDQITSHPKFPHHNLSYNHPVDDSVAQGLGIDFDDDDSPYNFKDLPIPECVCDIRGCVCPHSRMDNGDIPPPLFHSQGGPKAFCRNVKCSNLQEVLKNPICAKKKIKKSRAIRPCLPEQEFFTISSEMLKKCQFKKKLHEVQKPDPCTVNSSQNSSYNHVATHDIRPHFHCSFEIPSQGMYPLMPL